VTPRRRRPTRDDLLQENLDLRRRLRNRDQGPPAPDPEGLLGVVEAFADGFVMLHEDLTVLALSRGAERLFGAQSHAMLGQPVARLFPGETIVTHVRQLEAEHQTGVVKPRRLSLQARRGSGEEFRVEVTLAPHRFSGTSGWILLLRNLAVLQAVLETLDVVEQRYEALTEVIPVAMFRTDAQGRCLYVNRRWSELTGYPLLDALGDGWRLVVHPHDHHRVMRESEEPLVNGLPSRNEHRIRRADGATIWVLVEVVPERDSSGRVLGYVGTLTDITAQRAPQEMADGGFRLEQLTS